MGDNKSDRVVRPQVERGSGVRNKLLLGGVLLGVSFLVAVGISAAVPSLLPLTVLFVAVSVASAFFSVGKTYRGPCPYCSAEVLYRHAYGKRSFRCSSCRRPVALRMTGGILEFHREPGA